MFTSWWIPSEQYGKLTWKEAVFSSLFSDHLCDQKLFVAVFANNLLCTYRLWVNDVEYLPHWYRHFLYFKRNHKHHISISQSCSLSTRVSLMQTWSKPYDPHLSFFRSPNSLWSSYWGTQQEYLSMPFILSFIWQIYARGWQKTRKMYKNLYFAQRVEFS